MDDTIKNKFDDIDQLNSNSCFRVLNLNVSCQFSTDIFAENIGTHIELSRHGIIAVCKFDGSFRSIIDCEKRMKGSRQWNGSVTVMIETPQERRIKARIFRHGCVQFIGCRNYNEFIHIINVLTTYLSMDKHIYCKQSGKTTVYNFVDNKNGLCIDKIHNLNVIPLSVELDYNVVIDMKDLRHAIDEKGLTYEDTQRAINIKTGDPEKIIATIFHSGKVIICGGKNIEETIEKINVVRQLLSVLLFTQFQKYVKSTQ